MEEFLRLFKRAQKTERAPPPPRPAPDPRQILVCVCERARVCMNVSARRGRHTHTHTKKGAPVEKKRDQRSQEGRGARSWMAVLRARRLARSEAAPEPGCALRGCLPGWSLYFGELLLSS